MLLAKLASLWFLVPALLPQIANPQETEPLLHYDPPVDWYHSAGTNPDQYSSNEVNAGIQVYRFRPINGDIMQMMGQDLLRRWIDLQFQETNVASQPIWDRDSIPGAEAVFNIRFIEYVSGIMRQHVRTIIVARGSAAIMDASAATAEGWLRAGSSMQAMYRTLRVESASAPPKLANEFGPIGRQIAGLYVGTKPRYVVNLNRPVDYGGHRPAMHFYLFSAVGHVYRFYDVPPGDLRRFNFERAAQEDPLNAGWYTTSNGHLYMQFGSPNEREEIAVLLPQDGRVTIESVLYVKQ